MDADTAAGLEEGDEVALVHGEHLRGIMTIAEKFRADKEREAREVYRTTEEAHPGVDVRWLDMGSKEVLSRVRAERSRPAADVWWGAPSTMFAQAAQEYCRQYGS